MRTVIVGDVRTGTRITTIPVADASWSMVHRDAGTITARIPLDAEDFNALERRYVGGLYPGSTVYPSTTTYPEAATPVWRPGQGLRPEFLSAIEPVRCFMGVMEGTRILEAGPIWGWDYDDANGMLTVIAAGMWSIFDHRIVMGAISSGYAAWEQTWSALSLGTIAKRLVELAETHVGGELPIVLPDDVTAADDEDHTRTYNGYSVATVRDRINELMNVEGGPDIAFEPRLTTDGLAVEWVMRVGDPLLTQSGDDFVWDSRAPRGPVAGLSVHRDASAQAERAWATGFGMETSLLMSRAEPSNIGAPDLRDAGFPLTERVDEHSTVESQSRLNAHARSSLRSSLRPWMTWTMTVDATVSPTLGSYRPGDWAKVYVETRQSTPGVRPHRLLRHFLPTGYHRARIVKIAGGMGTTAIVTLAPQMEAR